MQINFRDSFRYILLSLIPIIAILWGDFHSYGIVAADSPTAISGDERFGINFVNSTEAMGAFPGKIGQRYQQATSAGARWTRWPMYWHELEDTKGAPNYAEYDDVLALDIANGLSTTVILMTTPSWAATSGDPNAPPPKPGDRTPKTSVTPSGIQLSSAIAPPKNLDLRWDHPDNYWGQFVYNTVMRYKDRVKVWEMWNEPDLITQTRWGPVPVFWSGTRAEYYLLLKVGYQAVKAADPQATVLFAGLAYWENEDFFPAILDYAIANDPTAPGAGFYFDVLPWHPYINPYFIYDWAARSRIQMQLRGIMKPVWVNETSIPVCGEWPSSCSPGDIWRATLEEQASYVIQAYAYAFAADVQRLSIFQLWDDGLARKDPPEYYGLASNTGSTRPSLKAYQVAATYFSRPTRVTRSPGEGYEKIVLEGTPHGKVTVAWATGGNDVSVAIPTSSALAQVVDQSGNVSTVSPSGGVYQMALPKATMNRDWSGRYIVGGKPYLFIEPAVVVSGKVTDNRHIPISGARVDVLSATYSSGVDGTGTYRLAVAPGYYDLQAGSSGYGSVPFRRLPVPDSLTYDFVLPPQQNFVRNWGFEDAGGVNNHWTTTGAVTTTPVLVHSGTQAARLGEWDSDQDATISQSGVEIPAGTYKPTVSFMYANFSSPEAGSSFYLEAKTPTNTFRLDIPLDTQGNWAHRWLDLSGVRGPVTLVFRLDKAGRSNLRIFLDEVSLGKATGGPNVLYFPMISR